MIVQSFRSVMWVGAVAGAAIGCYMVSLRVATERAALESVETRILMAKRDIRALDTELVTRGRVRQLERWNVDVLALSAPTEGQFLEGEVELASLTSPSLTAPSLTGPRPSASTQVEMAAKDAPVQAVPSPGAPVADVASDAASDAEVRPMIATYAVPEEKARNPLLVRASAPAPRARRAREAAPVESRMVEPRLVEPRLASVIKTVRDAAEPEASKPGKPKRAKAVSAASKSDVGSSATKPPLSRSSGAKKVKASKAL